MSRTSVILSLVLGWATSAGAQVVPIGIHQGGRPGPAASALGGAVDTVPLSFPGERDGLPLPLRIARSSGVGSAGLGWHLPLSYVLVSDTTSRRRPDYRADLSGWDGPQYLPRVSVALDGASVPMAAGPEGKYSPIRGHQTWELVQKSAGRWELTDGAGLRYRFEQLLGMPASSPFYLTEIASGLRPQARVVLHYLVQPAAIDGQLTSAPELLLDSIRYDFHPTGACSKHELQIEYQSQPGATGPLATAFENGQLRVTTQLVRSIAVMARGNDCGSQERLARYELYYGTDEDTGLPRLASVDAFGREGTPEETTALPVARYRYGRATQGSATGGDGGALRVVFAEEAPLPLPSGWTTDRIGRLSGTANNETLEILRDLNGDGLADLVRPGSGGALLLAAGRGGVSLDAPTALFPGVPSSTLSSENTSAMRNHYGYTESHVERTYRQIIDMNGDGRPDFIDAGAAPNIWRVYLNEPDPADPRLPSWRQIDIDVSNILYQLDLINPRIKEGSYLPLQRSQTGQHLEEHRCLTKNPVTGQYPTELPCPGWEHSHDAIRDQFSYVEWKLADVNGDGYPDLVANSAPLDYRVMGDVENPATCKQGMVDSGYYYCHTDSILDFGGATNQVRVFLNRGGRYLTGALTPFAAWVPLATGDGGSVEEWHGDFYYEVPLYNEAGLPIDKPLLPETSRQTRGFIDVNGDGIADRLTPGAALLGSGQVDGGVLGFPMRVAVPLYAIRARSGRVAACGLVDPAPPGTQYEVTRTGGILDVNGDGFPDVVDGMSVRFGTGLGWGDPVPVELFGSRDGLLSTIVETCDGADSLTRDGLFDVDGDGKPDLVMAGNTDGTPSDRLRVFKLQGSGGAGAPAAGRVTGVANGHGAEQYFGYGSAKLDTTTLHQLPFAEVVVTEEQTFNLGLSTAPAPVRYAYGDGRLVFDAALDRFSFRGYGRTVSVQKDAATISDAYRPEDLATGHERYALVGSPHTVYRLGGTMPTDAGALLGVAPSSDSRWNSLADTTYQVSFVTLPGYSVVTECSADVQGYHPPAQITTGGRWDTTCHARHAVAPRLARSDRGSQYSADKYIETRTTIVQVDDSERPDLILHEGDTHRGDDDFCEERLYASPGTSLWRNLLLPRSVRLFEGARGDAGGAMDCFRAQKLLAAERFTYDGLAEGSVDGGRPSSAIVERYDAAGHKLDEWTAGSLGYDAAGGLQMVIEDAGSGAVRTTTLTLDPFGIRPTAASVSASGLSGSLDANVSVMDPFTLDVVEGTDPAGLRLRTSRDGFGRTVVSSFIDPQDGQEYVTSAFRYLGETVVQPGGDQIDPAGRRTLARRFRDRRLMASFDPAAAAPGPDESWVTAWMDELGRPTRHVQDMGADYAAPLVSEVAFDDRGRIRFATDPYVSGSAGSHYGTTYLYQADGSLRCTVRGRGDLSGVGGADTSDPGQARFARCGDRRFEQFQSKIRSWGPDDASVWNETVYTAAGRLIEKSRRQGGTVFELMQLGHDTLGRQTSVTRFATPGTSTGAVTWTTGYDSLGQVTSIAEPGTSTRSLYWDHAGNLIETRWADGSATRSLRMEYDGLGRRLREYELASGAISNLVTFAYDQASGDGHQPPSASLRGRLAHAHSQAMSVYYGYDGLGRTSAQTWVDSDGTRVSHTFEQRLDGSLRRLGYQLPDDNYAEEEAVYDYDSAGRLRTVTWHDASSAQTLLSTLQSDPFGRPLTVRYGNLAQELWSYRNGDRRELVAHQVALPNGTSEQTSFLGYDGSLRVQSRWDVSSLRNEKSVFSYGADDRLASFHATQGTTTTANETYQYDGLGNLKALADSVGGNSYTLGMDSVDPDRVCNVKRPGLKLRTGCQFHYDVLGNVTEVGDRALRLIAYDGRGRAQTVQQGSTVAQLGYGPLGEVAALDVYGGSLADPRHSRRYGGLVELRGGVLARRVPGASGVVMERRGAGAGAQESWWHGDGQGLRAVTDSHGRLAQEVDYRPFGEVRRDSAPPSRSDYSSYQYNGDLLADLGLYQMGARLYEPNTGRFLQRDPLMSLRSASRAHPYAFAWNDPVNFADPTGLDGESASNLNPQPGLVALAITSAWLVSFIDGAEQSTANLPGPAQHAVAQSLFNLETLRQKAAFDLAVANQRPPSEEWRAAMVNYKRPWRAPSGTWHLFWNLDSDGGETVYDSQGNELVRYDYHGGSMKGLIDDLADAVLAGGVTKAGSLGIRADPRRGHRYWWRPDPKRGVALRRRWWRRR